MYTVKYNNMLHGQPVTLKVSCPATEEARGAQEVGRGCGQEC